MATEYQYLQAGHLAVEGQADLLVAGASYAGCAAALEAAMNGLKVILVEPRTYPGYETSALHRPWMSAGVISNPPDLFKPWLSEAIRKIDHTNTVALKPDSVKRGLEDVLLAAGVRILYASQPVGVVFEGKDLAGIVIAGKSGRRVLLARAIADATEWALVARMAGAKASLRQKLPAPIKAFRTLEFTGVEPGELGSFWHEGFLGNGHQCLEQELDLSLATADIDGLMKMEFEARRQTVDLVEKLKSESAPLKKALFAQASYELTLLSPFLVTSDRAGLAVLSSASEKDEARAWELFDPANAARLGQAAATSLIQALKPRRMPVAARCLASCGSIRPGKPKDKVRDMQIPALKARGVSTQVRTQGEWIPMLADVDVLVAGGGTAGAVAAPAAAERGVGTVLLEMNSGLGGTGTLGGVNTYWYGRKQGFTAEVDRRYVAVAARLGATRMQMTRLDHLPAGANWHVEAKMQALLDWSLEAGAKVCFRSSVTGALVLKNSVKGALVATPDGLRAVRAKVTVESTGDGDIAAHAGAEFQAGAKRDGISMFCSLGPIPRPGAPTNSFGGWVDVSDPSDYSRAILAGRRRFMGYDHGPYLAPRESRHVAGSYTLTLQDHLTHRQHADVVCICNDGRDIKGLTSADWALWGLELGKVDAEIPFRAVLPKKIDGLLMGSKAYSATHEGLSLARMQADMQNLGGSMGAAAAISARLGLEPRKLKIKTLQAELVKAGAMPKSILKRRIAPDPTLGMIERIVAGLKGNELEYRENSWMDVEPKAQPVALCCAFGPKALPVLKAAFEKAKGPRQLLLARLLAWYGSRLGSNVIIARIEKGLASGSLSELRIHRRPPPPDNAGMPLICRLIYTLGLSREPRAIPVMRRMAELLDGSSENLATYGSGAFYYVQMACLTAEALGKAEALPVLELLHAKPGLHGLKTKGMQSGITDERFGYLELALGRAMARCGSVKGAKILVDYLDDGRAYLAEHALSELKSVTGWKLGWEQKNWLSRLAKVRALRPKPWTLRGEL